jgi:hypothetical protein
MAKTICYCFNYTDADIIKDVRANNGTSLILERIAKAKREHLCECESKHPEKR